MNNEWQDLPNMAAVCAVQADGWEIEYRHMMEEHWLEWNGTWWNEDSYFRGRPKQPKTKKVTLECWIHRSTGSTCTRKAGFNDDLKYEDRWVRFPVGDMTGEIEA